MDIALRLAKGIVLPDRKCLVTPRPCPLTPIDKSSASLNPSEGWWQVPQAISLLPDSTGSQNNILPRAIFSEVCGLSAGAVTARGKAAKAALTPALVVTPVPLV